MVDKNHPAASNEEVNCSRLGQLSKAAAIYDLRHRRFAHCGPSKLSKLNQFTTLEAKIPNPPTDGHVCEVYALTKIRKQIHHKVQDRKLAALDLVSMDIAGPFPASLKGNRYFMGVANNHSRKTWSYTCKDRKDVVRLLQHCTFVESRSKLNQIAR